MKLSQKIFSKNDQDLFAQFSGDFNDIHCNEINARKKIYGKCIVHGINAVLYSLDQLVKHINNIKLNMKIVFHEPIFLNEKINLTYNKKEKTLLIKSNKKTAIVISFISQHKNIALNKVQPKNKKNLKFAKKNLINNIKIGDKKKFSIRGNPNLSIKIFPNLVKQYGIFTISEIAALSQLVGMECPGENSTFVSLTISQNNLDLKPTFEVDKVDKRFGLILINVMGNTICSDLRVLMSNNEKKSENTKISKLKSHIKKNELLKIKFYSLKYLLV